MNFNKYGRTANLLDNVLVSTTYDGVTVTLNPDKSITVNGTLETTSQALFKIGTVLFENGESYTISGVTGYTSITMQMFTESNTAFPRGNRLQCFNGAITRTALGDETCDVNLYIYGGAVFDNVKIYPFICKGSTALPYQPYKDWTDTPNYVHNTSTDTITTLPAVLYPTETTATVGLKGNMYQASGVSPTTPIQPSECGERTGNLFDKSMADLYNHSTLGQTNTWAYSVESTGTTLRIPCDANTQYTLTIGSNVGNSIFRISEISTDNAPIEGGSGGIVCHTILNGGAINSHTFTTASDTKYILLQVNSDVTTVAINTLMLNTGSTALPYEPYGYKIPISSANTTTPVYLGEVESTRTVKKLVLTGEENVDYNNVEKTLQYIQCRYTLSYTGTSIPTNVISSHLETASAPSETARSEKIVMRANATDILFGLAFSTIGAETTDTNTAILSKAKSYLAAQYAAGTPVTVWYVLATPTTGIVNEPIRKIGTYADEVSGITIPTIAGANTISIGTTLQPSEVSVNYKGWHPVSAVHEAEQGNNLFDYTTMATSEENSYLMPDGSIGDSNDWNISDYIPCDGTSFAIGYIGGNTPAICLYNENKQYITGKSYNTGGASSKNAVTITSQNTAKYIRFSYCKASGASYDDLSAIMLNKGGSLLTYEPYGTHWD